MTQPQHAPAAQLQRLAIDGDVVSTVDGIAGTAVEFVVEDRPFWGGMNRIDVLQVATADGVRGADYADVVLAADSQAQGPVEGLPQELVHPAPDHLADTFEAVIDRSMWAIPLRKLMEKAREQGLDLLMVGGSVRDIIAGKGVEAVNDIDLTGNIPAIVMREWMNGVLREDPADAAMVEIRGLRVTMPGNVVKIEYRADTQIEYMMLARRFDSSAERWTRGSDLLADLSHRDVSVNTVMYDPVRRELLDPSGRGLEDIEKRLVRPIDCPERDYHWELPLNNFTRALKMLRKFDSADARPFAEWFEKNEHAMRAAKESHPSVWRALLYHKTLGAFGIEVNDTRRRDEAAEERIAARDEMTEWLIRVMPGAREYLEACRGDGLDRQRFAAADWIPRGDGLRWVVGDQPPYRLGEPLLERVTGYSLYEAAFDMLVDPTPCTVELGFGGDLVTARGAVDAHKRRVVETDDLGVPLIER
jgi:hypothetical protein